MGMENRSYELPEDPTQLREIVLSLMGEREKWNSERESLQWKTEHLQEQVKLLLAKLFGRSSEKNKVQDHPSLFDEAEFEAEVHPEAEDDEPEGVEVTSHTRSKKGRRPLPDGLPREEVIHDLPEENKVCGLDGHTLQEIGRETSEQLDIVPAQVKVIRHVRIKYGCPHCRQGVQTAPLPPRLLPKVLATAATLAWIAASKYADGLPLYRLESILGRAGIQIPRATTAHWMIGCGEGVQPLINLIQDRMLAYGYIQMDETPVQVLKEPGRPATSKSYMWVRKGGPLEAPVVLFNYDPSRSGQVPKDLLEEYKGWLQTDAYKGYLAVGSRPDVHHLGCWAHVRRRFVDAVKAGGNKAKASYAVKLIGKLYRIEKRLRESKADANERLKVRQQEVPPVLAKLRDWMSDLVPKVVPSSTLGKALGYLHDEWPRLIRYTEDGRLEIDNNGAENAIRPFVVGRKNWLFSNSVRGVKSSANLYGLIETAKANGLEPYAYLRHVFEQIPFAQTAGDFDALLPWNLNPDMTIKVEEPA